MRAHRDISNRERLRRCELARARGAAAAGARGTTASPPAATAAHATADLTSEAQGEHGVVLARQTGGERALPTAGSRVVLSQTRLCNHVLVLGATGSGKTETLMRLAWTVAHSTTAPVFYIDGKGDTDAAERFVGLMGDAGRATRVFPNEPLDGWRGEPHEIRARLLEIVDYATDGPAAWYRDVAKAVIGLACNDPAGPPRGSEQLLDRLDLEALMAAHGDVRALKGLRPGLIDQVRLRYEAVLGETRGALDGDWGWEDTQAAYLLLDSLRLPEESKGLARFLFEDYAHYFTARKRKADPCLLIVDEFSALASTPGMAGRVEQARGFNAALVLAPQVVAGMGGALEAARILGSVQTLVCQRMNTPDELVELAGTKLVQEYATRMTREGPTGEATMTPRKEHKIDPDRVRGLAQGEAFLISHGRAMKAQILRAPELRIPLPAPSHTSPESNSEPNPNESKDGDEQCSSTENTQNATDFLP